MNYSDPFVFWHQSTSVMHFISQEVIKGEFVQIFHWFMTEGRIYAVTMHSSRFLFRKEKKTLSQLKIGRICHIYISLSENKPLREKVSVVLLEETQSAHTLLVLFRVLVPVCTTLGVSLVIRPTSHKPLNWNDKCVIYSAFYNFQ